MSTLTIVSLVLAALYIAATFAAMPATRWAATFNRTAIAVAAVALAVYVAEGLFIGPGRFVFAGIWLFNGAMSYLSLRMSAHTRRSYSRI